MKHYTDLFIDFDDTLYDTHGNARLALQELYDHYALHRYFDRCETFFDDYWATNIDLWSRYARGEITRDYLIVERFRHPLALGRGLTVSEELCRRVSDTFLDYCATKPGVVDGARELMDHLHRRGYRMHLCSNGFHEVQYRKLRACGLEHFFTTIILSEDAGANKPSATFFDYAFSTSGARRATTLMIGDSLQTDIEGASRYGLDTIFFNRFPDYPAPPGTTTMEVHSLSDIMSLL